MFSGQLFRFFCLIIVPGVACTLRVSAQSGGSFTTICNVQKAGVADVIEVAYIARDIEDIETISPGQFSDFVVVGGPYQEQSVQSAYTGGRMMQSEEIILRYHLQPRHTGSLTIPAATARDAAGHSYQSNVITIQAVPGSVRPAKRQQRQSSPLPRRQTNLFDPFDDPFSGHTASVPQRRTAPAAPSVDLSREIFLRVEVDKTSVTVGEPVIASYKLFTRLPMEASVTKMPVLNGFWSQDFPISQRPQPVSQMVNGRGYQTFLLKKIALYPTEAGTLTLDPAFAEGVVHIQRTGQSDPFGGGTLPDDPFFSQTFSTDAFGDYIYENIPVSLQSRPVIINVVALPAAARPANWNGAVGRFSISSHLQHTSISEDDEAILQVTIRGTGNTKLLKAPALQLPDGIESTPSGARDTIFGTTGETGRIFSYIISAPGAGSYSIPAVSLSYYDPEAKKYRTASSVPANLTVKAGTDGKDDKGYSALDKTGSRKATDIAGAGSPEKARWTSSPVLWTACLLPLLLLGIYLAKRKASSGITQQAVQTAGLSDSAENKKTAAQVPGPPVASLLASAHTALNAGQYSAFYRDTALAISGSLSTVLDGMAITQVPRSFLSDALRAKSVPVSLSAAAFRVLDTCDAALYAPAGTIPDNAVVQELYTTAGTVTDALLTHAQSNPA